MNTPKQTDPQFKLRMTPEIKDAIEAAAKKNSRSMNAEILVRLEMSFSEGSFDSEMEAMDARLRALNETIINETDKQAGLKARVRDLEQQISDLATQTQQTLEFLQAKHGAKT